MYHKIIFIALGAALFGLAAVGGYYAPVWLNERKQQEAMRAFVPPGVPVSASRDFSRSFFKMNAAKEPLPFPGFEFVDINGKAAHISDFAGKPVLVNFWASWCAPCVRELPSLEKLRSFYEGKLQVIGISVDQNTARDDIRAFLARRQVGDFAGYVDQNGLFLRNMALSGIPTSFLIGSDGMILYRFEGDADWTSQEAKAFFDIFILQNR